MNDLTQYLSTKKKLELALIEITKLKRTAIIDKNTLTKCYIHNVVLKNKISKYATSTKILKSKLANYKIENKKLLRNKPYSFLSVHLKKKAQRLIVERELNNNLNIEYIAKECKTTYTIIRKLILKHREKENATIP